MIPGEKEWIIIFSSTTTAWGSFFYDPNEDALRVTVTPVAAPFEEWLNYGFDDLTNNSATLYLHWAEKKIPIKIEFNSVVIKSIEDQLKGAAAFNWQNWMQAAAYCYQINDHLDKAESWVRKSVGMQENANNRNLLGYVLMAEGKNEEALKVFEENVAKYPDNWNVYDSLGEIYAKLGKKSEAIENYKTAMEKAPANMKQRIQSIINNL